MTFPSNAKLSLRKAKAERLVRSLYEAYRARRGLYRLKHASTSAPQNLFIPKGVERGSPLHARWLFFATMTDVRQVSMFVYPAHVDLYANHPELYHKDVSKWDLDTLQELLVKHKIGVPRRSAINWLRCAKTLYEEFAGDPLALFAHCGGTVAGVQEFRKRKGEENPLPGFGPKITSLYALFLAELGLLPFPEDAFPVDVHVQRLFIQTGAVTLHETVTNEDMERLLRPTLCALAAKHKLDKVDLAHALWFLGSQMCTKCYSQRAAHLLCPSGAYGMCSGPVNTLTYFKKGTWDPATPRMRKGGCRELRMDAKVETANEPQLVLVMLM